jgi:hypothetical protein
MTEMRARKLVMIGIAIVIGAAIVAHGLVYWTPWFGARKDFGISGVFETRDAIAPAITYQPARYYERVSDVSQLSDGEFNRRVEALFNHLISLTDEELILAIASDDKFCESPVLQCYGLPLKVAKPFGERALAHKQRVQTIELTQGGMVTSRIGVSISFLALLLSAAGFTVSLLNYRKGSTGPAASPGRSRMS